MIRRRRDLVDAETVDDLPQAFAELRAVTGEEAIGLRGRLRAIENRLDRMERVQQQVVETPGPAPDRKRASGRRTGTKTGQGRNAAPAARKPKATARAQKASAKRRRQTPKRRRAASPDTEERTR